MDACEVIRRLAIVVIASCMIAMIVLIIQDVMDDREVWKEALGHDRNETVPYFDRETGPASEGTVADEGR